MALNLDALKAKLGNQKTASYTGLNIENLKNKLSGTPGVIKKDPKIFSGGLFSDIIDVPQALQYGLTGLASGRTFAEGVKRGQAPSQEFGVKGVKGFVLDVLSDPLTYVGIGALTKAGKAAKAAGTLKTTLGGAVKAGQRSLVGIDIPFTNFLKGTTLVKGAGAAEKLTQAGELIKRTPILGDALQKIGVRKPTGLMKLDDIEKSAFKTQSAIDIQKLADARAAAAKSNIENKLVPILQKGFKQGLKESDFKDMSAVISGIKGVSLSEKALKLLNTDLAPIVKELTTEYTKETGKALAGKKLTNVLTKEAREGLVDGTEYIKGFKTLREQGSEKFGGYVKLGDDVVYSTKKGANSLLTDKTYTKVGDGYIESSKASKIEQLEELLKKAKADDTIKKAPIYRELSNLMKSKQTREAVSSRELNEALVKIGKPAIFEENIFNILSKQGEQLGIIKARKEMIKSLMDKKVFPEMLAVNKGGKMPKGYTRLNVKGLEDFALPKDMAEPVNKIHQKFSNVESINDFFKKYDKLQNFWKKTATYVNPSFHIRNFLSNNWQLHLADTFNPVKVVNDYRQVRKLNNVLRKGGKVEDVIKNAKEAQMYKDFLRDGVGQTGRFTADIEETVLKKRSALNKPFNYFAQVGGNVEDAAKWTLYKARRAEGFTPETARMEVAKYLFDYNDLTDFEKNVMKRAFPFWCVPDDTEILTRDGWKTREELSKGEEVLTYNVDNNVTEWQVVDDVAVFDFDDDLMTLENKRGVKFRFTKDHRFPVFDYKGDAKIIRAYEFNTGHKIPLTAPHINDGESILTVKEAALLGWLVTDGYTRWRGSSMEAMIYQSTKKYANKIRTMFGNWISSESIHPDTGVLCFRIKASATEGIRKYFKTKDDMPSIVTRLSLPAMEAMFEAMMEAEGSKHLTKGHQFTQKLGGVMDSFQILCELLGKHFNISVRKDKFIGVGYIRDTKVMKIACSKLGVEHYEGKIWCPKTKNSTWIMRQNGKTIITGNTWARKNVPLQVSMLIQRPGKFSAIDKAKRAVESMSDGEPMDERLLPEWMQTGYNVWLGKNPEGMDRFLKLEGMLPAVDISMIGRPFDEAIDSLTPMVKTPIELLANYDFFYKNQIQEYEGQTKPIAGMEVPAKVEKIVRSFRPISEYEKLFGLSTSATQKDLTGGDRLSQFLFGRNIRAFDKENEEYWAGVDKNKIESKIKSDLKKAKKAGNQKKIDSLTELLSNLK